MYPVQWTTAYWASPSFTGPRPFLQEECLSDHFRPQGSGGEDADGSFGI